MHDPSRTNHELIKENVLLMQRIQELEKSEAERKRAEEALRQSEERYRTLIETTRDLIYTTDRKGFLTYVNPTLERILGYSHNELDGKSFAQIVAPECIDSVTDRFKRAIKGETVPVYEADLIRKDGTRISVEFNVVTIYDHDGNPSGRYGIGRDVTDRKRAEEALREGEHRLHSIIGGSPIPAFVIGKDHRVIHWNKALKEMSRIKSEEVIGTCEHWRAFYKEERPSMADLLVDESVDLVPQWYSGKYIKSPLIEGAYEATDFFSALGEDGKWLRFTAAAIRDSKGMIVAAVETLEDITDRKHAEEALRESEELYKTLAERSMAGVYVVQDGNFRFINSNAASYAGYTREELLDQKAALIVSPEDREKARQNARALLRGEESSPYEFRIITKKGETRWIMETVTSILYEGRPAILGNSMDITDRKQMEQEIRALSLTDLLTGLYNRRGFLTLAEQQLKIAERTKNGLLLLFADLDGMKWINDNLGHKKGDEALIEAADVFKDVFREADIVARIGGDEFCVLAEGISMENSRIIEDRLRYQLDINNSRENRNYPLSMSIGMIYNDPENPSTIDELMSRADALMYEQKKGKRS